jgi:hypothetical protein
MNVRACLVSIAVVLSLCFAAPGRAQIPNPPCDGCFTTPLAATGNGSCFVTLCFTFDPVAQKVTVTSVQKVTASDCSGLGVVGSGPLTPQLMEAVQKEAIRIAIERCALCNTTGTRIFSSVGPKCFRPTKTATWIACLTDTCRISYEVTCNPMDPYSWTWGAKWGAPCDNTCSDPNPACTSLCG